MAIYKLKRYSQGDNSDNTLANTAIGLGTATALGGGLYMHHNAGNWQKEGIKQANALGYKDGVKTTVSNVNGLDKVTKSELTFNRYGARGNMSGINDFQKIKNSKNMQGFIKNAKFGRNVALGGTALLATGLIGRALKNNDN